VQTATRDVNWQFFLRSVSQFVLNRQRLQLTLPSHRTDYTEWAKIQNRIWNINNFQILLWILAHLYMPVSIISDELQTSFPVRGYHNVRCLRLTQNSKDCNAERIVANSFDTNLAWHRVIIGFWPICIYSYNRRGSMLGQGTSSPPSDQIKHRFATFSKFINSLQKGRKIYFVVFRLKARTYAFRLNPLKPSGYYMYHILQNAKTLHFTHTECICVFRMVLTINSDCFLKQH
jgi:hypothetical protein